MIQPIAKQADQHVATAERIEHLLRQPAPYRQREAKVDCLETHTSWVFLTDRFAFKLKKPVRFDFLDFSTVARREKACRDELRLNRRLGSEVYLDVVPISLLGKQVRLGPGGKVIDWVVKMRRLPADRALDRLIVTGALRPHDVDRIGDVLSEFYLQLPPVTIKTDEYLKRFAQHMRSNERELRKACYELDAALVGSVHEAQRQYLIFGREALRGRVLDGRIVEGHGDLRPEHIYLAPHPVVIDCIEFNREYRILDVADELAFFAMECKKLDAPWIGQSILDRYQTETGDILSARLLAFYSAYRACVRAKVSVLRAAQLSGPRRDSLLDDGRRYLELAGEYARQVAPPLLLVIRGLSGSGKSTLAHRIAQQLGIAHLQTDVIRQELLGKSQRTWGYGQGRYELASRQLVYNELMHRAGELLRQGRSVILDGTFLRGPWRSQALSVANQHRASAAFIHCECAPAIARERISQRTSAGDTHSDARNDILNRQHREAEPDPHGIETIPIDTTHPLAMQVDQFVDAVKGAWA